jgi:timeless
MGVFLFVYMFTWWCLCSVIKEQIKLRENALQQVDTLMDYKRLFCYHPSHLKSSTSATTTKDDDGNGNENNGILSIFVSLLAEPLSRTGASRTDSDHLIIELTLHLFRNLLSIEPILHTSSTSRETATMLHCELISLLEQELVLEILLVLGADIELRENSHYNLLLMELLHHLLRNQDPAAVARSTSCKTQSSTISSISKAASAQQHNQPHNGTLTISKSLHLKQKQQPQQRNYAGAGRLTESLFREQQRKAAAATNRHSHFAGTIRLKHTLGSSSKSQYVSAAMMLGPSNSNTNSIVSGAGIGGGRGNIGGRSMTTKKNKMLEPFIGATTNVCNQCHTNINRFPLVNSNNSSLTRQRAYQTLDKFCHRFLDDCYGPVMKSLKNEFRRDSARLEDTDTTVLFRIIWFFCQWYRISDYKKKQKSIKIASEVSKCQDKESADNDNTSSIGSLIFTMDVFTYNLVLSSIETFQVTKKYTRLAQGVALLSEMMHLLYEMFISSSSSTSNKSTSTASSELNTEHLMALGLMDRLFYGDEPLDNLPKLLSKWSPGTNTREHLCNIMELCYMTLKLLDANSRLCNKQDRINSDNTVGNNSDDADNNAGTTDSSKHDTITKMKKSALDFNVNSYFARKILGSNFITACTNLLSMYEVNAPTVNHRLIALLTRTCKHVISMPEDSNSDSTTTITSGSSLLINRVVTFEPILYNIQMLNVFNNILNDASIRNDKDYTIVVNFASTIIYNFAIASTGPRAAANNDINPLLFVEAIFKHPIQHRYCDNVTNMYITEELRMLVDREILREENAKIMVYANDDDENDFDENMIHDDKKECSNESDDDNDDDTNDFQNLTKEFSTESTTSPTLSTIPSKQCNIDDTDDDDDDELELE